MPEVPLSEADIDAVARRIVAILRSEGVVQPEPVTADSDPWLTRRQAAAYLNFSTGSFARARLRHVEALKPCSVNPLRWSRNALDVFKLTRGRPLHNRPGRKRQDWMPSASE